MGREGMGRGEGGGGCGGLQRQHGLGHVHATRQPSSQLADPPEQLGGRARTGRRWERGDSRLHRECAALPAALAHGANEQLARGGVEGKYLREVEGGRHHQPLGRQPSLLAEEERCEQRGVDAEV